MKEIWKLLWCTNGGLGLLPVAPGTWGSLKPVIAVLVLRHFDVPPLLTMGVLIAVLVISSFVTIKLAPWYTSHFARKDPPQVVSDEVAGQSIALLGMAWLSPNEVSAGVWLGLAVLAFVLFRILDIKKPLLINHVQTLPKGWGVLIDDILAGIVSGVVVSVAALLLR